MKNLITGSLKICSYFKHADNKILTLYMRSICTQEERSLPDRFGIGSVLTPAHSSVKTNNNKKHKV